MVMCPLCNNDNEKLMHGVEIRGVYDGILFWHCVVCGHDWPRFSEGRLHQRALDVITRWGSGQG